MLLCVGFLFLDTEITILVNRREWFGRVDNVTQSAEMNARNLLCDPVNELSSLIHYGLL